MYELIPDSCINTNLYIIKVNEICYIDTLKDVDTFYAWKTWT